MDTLVSLNSVRAPDASKDFTLRLNWEDWASLATVAGRKAVTLDVVTRNDMGYDMEYYSDITVDQGTSKEMMDGIFGRFPRLKFIKFHEKSHDICGIIISSFLDTYQVGISGEARGTRRLGPGAASPQECT